MSASGHLRWCVERALACYDRGDHEEAVLSLISDIGKHDDTAWIQDYPFTFDILNRGVEKGRDQFERAMNGFAK